MKKPDNAQEAIAHGIQAMLEDIDLEMRGLVMIIDEYGTDDGEPAPSAMEKAEATIKLVNIYNALKQANKAKS